MGEIMWKMFMVTAGFKYASQVRQPVVGLILLGLFTFANPVASLAQAPRNTATPSRTGGVTVEGAYTLGAGDRILLDIFNVPEYSREYQVLVNGTVNFPLIGSVSLDGLTLEQAGNFISQQYARFLRRPIVTVSLVAPRPLQIALAGEVNRPGSYTVPYTGAGGGVQQPTLSQALVLAGGITQAADLGGVRVRRVQRGGTQVFNLNLWSLVRGGDLSQDLTLRDGDSIFIPTTTSVNLADAPIKANTNLYPTQTQPFNIVVAGEVTRPGPYTVQASQGGAPITVSRALQVAGGITQSADISQVLVRRQTRTGAEQSAVVNLNALLQGGDRRQDLILQEGDTIVIPTSREVNTAQSLELASSSFAADPSQPLNVAVVGEVQRPGTYTIQPSRSAPSAPGALPALAGVPTVSQALQIAGGITQSADIRRIEVRRTTRVGTQQILAVNFWQLLQAGDRTQDVVLQQGDTIFIPTATDVSPAEAAQVASASISPVTIRVNIVGEVARPGVVEVPPNTPLNQALLAAGGFNNRARRSFVELLRLNPNGTVSKRGIDIDFAKGISEENNPTLRSNDVIVVRRSSLANISDTLGTILSPVGNFFSLFNFFRIFGF